MPRGGFGGRLGGRSDIYLGESSKKRLKELSTENFEMHSWKGSEKRSEELLAGGFEVRSWRRLVESSEQDSAGDSEMHAEQDSEE